MNYEANVPFPTAQEWAADLWQCGRTSSELRRMLQLRKRAKFRRQFCATNACAYKVWSHGAKMIVTNNRWHEDVAELEPSNQAWLHHNSIQR